MKQIIAVDVDDVLAEHAPAFVSWSNQKYGTRLSVENYTEHWSEIWQVDHEETEKRALLFHDEGGHADFESKKDAKQVLENLKNNYELKIVTARRKSVIKDSLEWIENNYPGLFSEVRFVPFWEPGNDITKADICRDIGANYLIDDSLKHIDVAAREGIRSLLFGDYNWNQTDDLPPNAVRVNSWLDVENYFNGQL